MGYDYEEQKARVRLRQKAMRILKDRHKEEFEKIKIKLRKEMKQ